MIKITNIQTYGWEAAIRGMRNPMNSWEKSDTVFCKDTCETCPGSKTGYCGYLGIGDNDLSLMLKLAKAGTDHAKYRRMITVTMDILAPLYWWKEFDTYKVGTVANSCSTMHKITEKEFTIDDFSHEHLFSKSFSSLDLLCGIVDELNHWRLQYLELSQIDEKVWELAPKSKEIEGHTLSEAKKIVWWQIIQLLPSSYNQLRTVQLNYEVLANIYRSRREHKLDEWRELCAEIEKLPYSEIITLREGSK